MLLSVVILCHLWTWVPGSEAMPYSCQPLLYWGKAHRDEGKQSRAVTENQTTLPLLTLEQRQASNPLESEKLPSLLQALPLILSALPLPPTALGKILTCLPTQQLRIQKYDSLKVTSEWVKTQILLRKPIRACLSDYKYEHSLSAGTCCFGSWNVVVLRYRYFSDNTGGALETFPCWVFKSPRSPIPHLCLQLASPSPPCCLSKTLASWLCLKKQWINIYWALTKDQVLF